jgi:hypothetical protein
MYKEGDHVKFTEDDGECAWVVEAVATSILTGAVRVRFQPVLPDLPESSAFVPGYYPWQPKGLVSAAALRPPIMWWDDDPNAEEIKERRPGGLRARDHSRSG